MPDDQTPPTSPTPPSFTPPAAEPAIPAQDATPAFAPTTPGDSAVPQPPTSAPSAPQSEVADDKVWISKEEYQRLQQSQVIASRNPEQVVGKTARLIGKMQIVTAATASIALILGLMMQSSFGDIFMFPSLLILALLAGFTVHDYLQRKKPGASMATHKSRNVTLLVLSLVVLGSPVLIIIFFILLFTIMCAGGGCQGT